MTGPAVDHLLYVAPDLEAGMDRVERLLGIRPARGGRHPQYGTRNALVAIGPGCYLEVMAPDPELSPPERGVLFELDRLREPRLLTWVLRHPAIDPAAETAGLGAVGEGHRERDDGTVLSWRLSDPYEDRFGGIVPFVIDWGDTPHPAESAPPAGELVELQLSHPEPEGVRSRLDRLGVPPTRAGAGDAVARGDAVVRGEAVVPPGVSVVVGRGREPRLTARIRTARGVVELR